jgi:raffinose/stachyose/melibiose transport system substrate-binding protein
MKKVLAMLLVFAMIASFAACGSSSNSSTVNEESSAVSSDKVSSSTEEESSTGEKFSGSISIACSSQEAKALQEVLKSYNEQEDVDEVTIDPITVESVGDFEGLMTSWISSDTLPDMYISQVGSLQQSYAANGYLLPLTEYGFLDRLVAGDTELIKYDGDDYAVPMNQSISVIYVNNAALKEAGIEIDETNYPNTWDEFVDILDQLVAAGVQYPFSLAGQDASAVTALPFQYIYQVVYGANPNWYADMLKGENGAAWNDELFLGMFDKYGELLKYVSEDVLGVSKDERLARFVTGESPIYVDTSGAMPGIRELDPEADVIMLPSCFVDDPADQTIISSFDSAVSITTGAEKKGNVELCVDFLDYLTTVEGSTIFNNITGYVPTIVDCESEVDPAFDIVLSILNKGELPNSPMLSREWIPGIKEVMKNGCQNWLAGEDPKSVADTIQAEQDRLEEASPDWVEDFLANYNYK